MVYPCILCGLKTIKRHNTPHGSSALAATIGALSIEQPFGSQSPAVLMAWSLGLHWLRCLDDGLITYAFVLRDHLSAEEENQGSNLHTQ